MRRPSVIALLLFVAWCFAAANCSAQIFFPLPYPGPYLRPYPHPYRPAYVDPSNTEPPVEIGGYVGLGGVLDETSQSYSGGIAGLAGIYGQWNRNGWCPGLDARLQGNNEDLHGGLFGPRLAYKPEGVLSDFHPYIELLAGPNELPQNAINPATIISPGSGSPTLPSRRGVLVTGAIGLDVNYGTHVRWRVIEFTKGTFTGLAGSQPSTIMTGIVVHVP
jgi:hypothetical protein